MGLTDRAGQTLPELVGQRVRLRAWQESDARALVEACQDEQIQRWTRVPSPYTAEDARDFLSIGVPATHGRRGAAFCFESIERPGLAGSMALLELDEGLGEIGFWTAPPARGQGFTSEALLLLVSWSFEALGAARLELYIEPSNAASVVLARRSGFEEEGLLRSRLLIHDMRRDALIFGRIPGDHAVARDRS